MKKKYAIIAKDRKGVKDMFKGSITDVPGIKVGHSEIKEGLTGVTVILPPEGTVAGVDVRGAAPGTRETDLLKPENTVQGVNAIFLSGGSAYGLAVGDGIMKALEEKGIGLDVVVAQVPIVAGAVIFDLTTGDPKIRPGAKEGYQAVVNAKEETAQGLVGAGLGASVGKYKGLEYAMKSGLGTASMKVGDLVVGALVITNAFGDIYDARNNEKIAGAYDREKKSFIDTRQALFNKEGQNFIGGNTTIACLATNGKFSKAQCQKIAGMAHNGYARSIFPTHTTNDGDTIFCLATGQVEADVSLVGAMATDVISQAIYNSVAVHNCGGLPGRESLEWPASRNRAGSEVKMNQVKKSPANQKSATRRLVIVAMLGAITFVLGLTPLGFVPIGPLNATTMHIPVIIGAVLEGPLVGALVGLIFGLSSLFNAITRPTAISFCFYNPLISIVPRILLGLIAGYLFKFLKDKDSHTTKTVVQVGWVAIIAFLLYGLYRSLVPEVKVYSAIFNGILSIVSLVLFFYLKKYDEKNFAVMVSAFVATIMHTIMVMGGIYIFFAERFLAALKPDASLDMARKVIFSFIFTSGVPEAIIAVIITAAVANAVRERIKN